MLTLATQLLEEITYSDRLQKITLQTQTIIYTCILLDKTDSEVYHVRQVTLTAKRRG